MMLTFLDFPPKAFELGAILHHDTSFELIDFLAQLQVVVAAHMVEEHADRVMD